MIKIKDLFRNKVDHVWFSAPGVEATANLRRLLRIINYSARNRIYSFIVLSQHK
jgi:hypothetical protein